jgi:hypothetical protein
MYKPSKCYLLLVRLLSLWFYPEDGSNTLLWKVSKLLPSHPRRWYWS